MFFELFIFGDSDDTMDIGSRFAELQLPNKRRRGNETFQEELFMDDGAGAGRNGITPVDAVLLVVAKQEQASVEDHAMPDGVSLGAQGEDAHGVVVRHRQGLRAEEVEVVAHLTHVDGVACCYAQAILKHAHPANLLPEEARGWAGVNVPDCAPVELRQRQYRGVIQNLVACQVGHARWCGAGNADTG